MGRSTDFFYKAATVKVAQMADLHRVNGKAEMTPTDVIFWTRMTSLNMAKKARGLGEVTTAEMFRIKRTSRLVLGTYQPEPVIPQEGTTDTAQVHKLR